MGLLDGWRYCPRCGASATQADGSSTCSACGFQVWAASIPGVQGLIVDDGGRVLLGRRSTDPGRGLWDIPGGFLNEGEDAVAGLHREIAEETGLEVELGAVSRNLDRGLRRAVRSLRDVDLRPAGGRLEPGDDLEHADWFAADRLPAPTEFAFPTHPEILGVWADGLRADISPD